MRIKVLAVAALIFAVSTFPALARDEEKVIALVGGTLIDGTGAPPVPDAIVIIKGERIAAVGRGDELQIPEEAEKIDVAGKWVLPGFIDLHVHSACPRDDKEYYGYTNSLGTLLALDFLNKYLPSGVTSVRDVGSPVEPMQAIMEASRRGYIDTIRIFPCGNLITVTGGHGYGLKGGLEADGPWEWRKAVREMYKAGFRHVKISPPYTLEEVRATVEETHAQGMRITSHGGGASDTEPPSMTGNAVKGGVQCVEHASKFEEGLLELMAEKGVHFVPTIYWIKRYYADGHFSELLKKRGWTLDVNEQVFKDAVKLNLVIGVGTDFTEEYAKLYPGLYFSEMEYFVELGLSRMEAIVCATKNGGIILGMEDDLGTIEAGKLADIQILSENPLESFKALGHPDMVLIGGRIKWSN
ncbi:MAG TPA: amidohydrolase family protein [Acidobacteriota bacterium]|nr:amidohydrolase family protein [Acidobacteriota bacterium]